ncbi:ATP-binding cassette domain-containing protein [Candidatus Woesebacteria bacterium]|nr:ATP-binding cassette domain-containing protein [Candidatus Woesebacteria bacterium]
MYRVTKRDGNFIKNLFIPKYREVLAVDNISLTIKEGETIAFLGPNGAGKTTTLKMLTGLIYPTSGEVSVLGFTPTDRKREFLRDIALVMGNKNSLSWDLTARQNLSLFISMYRTSEKISWKMIEEMAGMLEVSDLFDTQIRKMSLGQRLKFELIAAIFHKPAILFLDEPTIGLDIISKRKIRQFLRHINETEKTTVILTSHEMADIEKVCDRVVVINRGRIVFDNSMAALANKYKDKKYFDVILKKQVDREKVEKFGKIVSSHNLSYTLEVSREKQGETISKIISELPVEDIDIKPVPLDEIIEDLFK